MSKFIARSKQSHKVRQGEDQVRDKGSWHGEGGKSQAWGEDEVGGRGEGAEESNLEVKGRYCREGDSSRTSPKEKWKLTSSLRKAKDETIGEFKTSSEFIELLDKNYVAGFEDFRQDAIEAFPRVDFNSIMLPITIESSLLHASSEDVFFEIET